MKLLDTTNPRTHERAQAFLNDPKARKAFDLASAFRVHIVGLYYTRFGLEWNSGGKCEGDYLHHIDLALSGKRSVIHKRRCLDIEPGTAYLFPGNIPVERRCEKGGEVIYLTFRCEWLLGVDPLLDWPERTPTRIGPFIFDEWRALQNPKKRAEASTALALRAQVERWLAAVFPSLSTLLGRHLETHARFTEIFRLVEEKLGADLRISELAKVYGSSHHVFSRAFSNSTQITAKEYINRRLNQEALQLVIGTDLKVKEIADRLRFTDEFYFSRFFQKLNGMSPSQYRSRYYS